jgi:hypothetical protein
MVSEGPSSTRRICSAILAAPWMGIATYLAACPYPRWIASCSACHVVLFNDIREHANKHHLEELRPEGCCLGASPNGDRAGRHSLGGRPHPLSRRRTWARLLTKVHELDVMAGPPMRFPHGGHRRHYGSSPDPQGYWRSPGNHHLPRASRSGTTSPGAGLSAAAGVNEQTAPPLTPSSVTPPAAECPPQHAPDSCGCRRELPGAL